VAQHTQVIYTDDLDGSEASETVTFTLDGKQYELDLNEKNAAKFRQVFDRYIGAARKVGSSTGRRAGRTTAAVRTTTSTSDVDPKAVRAWAASNGIELSTRGRIPGHVVEQYRSAGN
jgi:hypothetical protein